MKIMKTVVAFALICLFAAPIVRAACEEPPTTPGGGGSSTIQISCDPNEMKGPLGFGNPDTQRFVRAGDWLTYTVYFENMSNATAAAQEVYVDAQLSPYLDWTTLELGEVVFNNQTELGLVGKQIGELLVQQKDATDKVKINFALDQATGAMRWYLRSYDPTRRQYDYWPEAVDAGFLPPNDETGRGEGHLTYRVKVKVNAQEGVRINASAEIIFDHNAMIPTDPSWWNTVTHSVAEPITYAVTYNANGATSGTVPASQTKTNNVALTLRTNTGNLARTGYTFAGWNTATNGTGTPYAVGASYTANAAVTLYAKWTVNTYAVTYNANGATSGTVPASQTKTNSVTLTLRTNSGNLAKTGSTFAGWNTATNGSGTDYAAGASYTANAAVTLYAKWIQAVATPTFSPDGGAYPGSSVKVKVSCMAPDATIRYTTNGSEPTPSSTAVASGGTVSVPIGKTLKARAWSATMGTGPIKSAHYRSLTQTAPWVDGSANPSEGGQVRGGGYCAAGRTVRVSAAANKGWTFLRWEDGSQVASRTVSGTEAAAGAVGGVMTCTAFFKRTADVTPPVITSPGAQSAMVGVAFALPLAITSEVPPKVKVTGLPRGLSFNATSRSIAGLPSAPTPAGVPAQVKVSVTSVANPKTPVVATFPLAVNPLPAWAVGAFEGVCVAGPNDDLGVATMAVSALGKISGNLRAAGATYAFSAASYAAGSGPAVGFTFVATAKAGKINLPPLGMRVTRATPAGGPAALGMAKGWFGPVAGDPAMVLYRNVWNDADMLRRATNFGGYYTATLPDASALEEAGNDFGSGYLALTVSKGSVTSAGKLADGTAASMSGALLVDESNRVFTVLYTAPKAYGGGCLIGRAEFVKEGGVTPVFLRPLYDEPFIWDSRNAKATGDLGDGFARDLWLVGGWYDKLGNLRDYYEGLSLQTAASGANAPELAVGANRYEAALWNPGGVELTPTLNKLGLMTGLSAPRAGVPVKNGTAWDYSAGNTVGLRISLSRPTGRFTGSFLAWFDYGTTHTSRPLYFEGLLTPEREIPEDGIEGRGFYLWRDQAKPPAPARTYPFDWSHDFLIQAQP